MTIKKYFGTDGIRGIANSTPLTAEFTTKLAAATGSVFINGNHRHRVIIGKDTRLSGYLLEPALTSGFVSVGMDVILVGPMPTPAIAFLTKALRADFGVMISASHNPYNYNGIKFFNKHGLKLSDEIELHIESLLETKSLEDLYVSADKLGKASRLKDAHGRYIEFVKGTFSKEYSLEGLRIAIDCANGSGYKIAPSILQELGAEILVINDQPDGFNINANCGSLHPQALQKVVLQNNCDLGVAIDGDADRLLLIDEKGQELNGDSILAAIAICLQEKSQLTNNIVVGTQMSNLGFENFLKANDIKLIRSQVGDRYVIENMLESEAVLGGEQSGHLICANYSYSADPIIALLQTLEYVLENKQSLSYLQNMFTAVPQILRNISIRKNADALQDATFLKYLDKINKDFDGKGRILVRKSGTEPLVRVMGECENKSNLQKIVDEVAGEIEKKVS